MGQRVNFKGSVKVRTIENRLDIIPQERSKTWYKRGELDMLLKSSMNDECKCGLEELLCPQRRSDCALVIRYVLREQRRQKSLGYRDADLLAAHYKKGNNETPVGGGEQV